MNQPTTAAHRLLHQRSLTGVAYSPLELGPAHDQTSDALLAALSLPTQGEIYDLDAGRWPGMPVLPVHPPFVLTTWRTPRRSEVDGDLAATLNRDGTRTGVSTELMSASQHTGTHIDALCHITENEGWFGGGREERHIGDFGPLFGEASSMPALVTRGVLVDIAKANDTDALPAGHEITVAEVERALHATRTQIRPGDTVLFRTGYMSVWPAADRERRAHYGAGIGLDVARFLADLGVVAVGADTEDFEAMPSRQPHSALPVHLKLLGEHGIHIMELLYLEQIAHAGSAEFLFVCLPLRIRGATGSMVRPIAIL